MVIDNNPRVTPEEHLALAADCVIAVLEDEAIDRIDGERTEGSAYLMLSDGSCLLARADSSTLAGTRHRDGYGLFYAHALDGRSQRSVWAPLERDEAEQLVATHLQAVA